MTDNSVLIDRQLLYTVAGIAREHAVANGYTQQQKGFMTLGWSAICDALDLAETGEIQPYTDSIYSTPDPGARPADDTDMTEEQFDALMEAGLPVHVAPSREEYEALVALVDLAASSPFTLEQVVAALTQLRDAEQPEGQDS